jgi:hypothetical protein
MLGFCLARRSFSKAGPLPARRRYEYRGCEHGGKFGSVFFSDFGTNST